MENLITWNMNYGEHKKKEDTPPLIQFILKQREKINRLTTINPIKCMIA